jgi:[acyl-carrier-protein] S-malonyltransferase
MIHDELRNQYLSYIYSCCCADVLAGKNFRPSMVAGYSMGIYASLYTAGSITFETGLLFIRKAYESIRGTLSSSDFGMGAVIGLSENDILGIIDKFHLNLLIVNRNSEYSFIVSGNSIPYHTNLLKDAAAELSGTVSITDVRDPEIPVISLLTRQIIADAQGAKNEVIRNIFNPFDWLLTQVEMYRSGIEIFTECGPSRALLKNSKFIPESGKFVIWSSLVKDGEE